MDLELRGVVQIEDRDLRTVHIDKATWLRMWMRSASIPKNRRDKEKRPEMHIQREKLVQEMSKQWVEEEQEAGERVVREEEEKREQVLVLNARAQVRIRTNKRVIDSVTKRPMQMCPKQFGWGSNQTEVEKQERGGGMDDEY